MNIERIALSCFMAHDATVLELPQTGLTVLTGANGKGKSNLVEGVSYLWRQTLRGTTPWREKQAGSVVVLTDEAEVLSGITKGGKWLLKARKRGEEGWQTRDRLADARQMIVDLLGDLEQWRRTRVFSSADAAHFSTATDSERKQLIEKALGMSIFDDAQSKCAADRKRADKQLQKLQAEVERLKAAYEGQKALHDSIQELPPFDEQQPPAEPQKPDEQRLVAVLEEIRELQEEITSFRQKGFELKGRLETARLRSERVSKAECGECGRPYEGAEREQAAALLVDAMELCRDEGLQLDAERDAAEQRLSECRQEERRIGDVAAQHKAWQSYRASWDLEQRARRKAHEREASLRRSRKQEAAGAFRKLLAKLIEVEEQVDQAQLALAELKAAEKSLRLIRSAVLSHALSGIEHVASTWLQRLAANPEARLELRSYTEKVTGGTTDAISIVVHGFGGGQSSTGEKWCKAAKGAYESHSAGQRRRIDASLILGLAELSGGEGTLWFDEVFDALDVEGRAAVVDCLVEVAERRSVVVITHQEDMAEQLRYAAVQSFEVVDGQLRRDV